MAAPREVQVLSRTEIGRHVGAEFVVELWITYQAGILAPRTITIPKAQYTVELERERIREDVARQEAGGAIERFTL